MVVAVTGGYHNAVDLANHIGIVVENGHAVGIVEFFCRLGLVAVYARHLNIGVLALPYQLKKMVGMGVFAA
jgi:hypothetical protein